MGKSDNIKRAKRLKATKRKREQDALLAAGLGPASKALKERTIYNGIEIRQNTSKIKYSELLKDFIKPIVNENDNTTTLKAKFTFAVLAWNAAIFSEKDKEAIRFAKEEITSGIPNNPEIGQLFDEMVKRKKEEFSNYKNIIADFEIMKVRGFDYDLTVATIPPPEDQ